MNLTPQNLIPHLLTLHRQGGVFTTRVDIPLAHLHGGMSHQFLDRKFSRSAFRQSSTERVPHGVKDKFAGKKCASPGGRRCVPQLRVHIVQARPSQMPVAAGKHPLRVGKEAEQEFQGFARPLGLRNDPSGVDRLPLLDRYSFRRNVVFAQRNTFFRTQAQIEYQNCGFFQRRGRDSQIGVLHFAGQHEHAPLFAGKQADKRFDGEQSHFQREQQSPAKCSQFPVDCNDRVRLSLLGLLPQSPVFERLDPQSIDLLERNGFEVRESEQSFHFVLIVLGRPLRLFVLPDVLHECFLKEILKRRRGLAGLQTDQTQRQVIADLGHDLLGDFFVFGMRRALMAFALKGEVEKIHRAALVKAHAAVLPYPIERGNSMNQEQIDNIFTYHKPFGNQPIRYEMLRAGAKILAERINDICPESREKALALTNLQQAIMWANASIAVNEKEI